MVHGTNYVAPPSRVPTVVSVYDCWFLAHPELATPIVLRAGATLRRLIGRGAWVHASSAATATRARDLLGTDRVVVVHLGAPTASPHTQAHSPTPDRAVAFAGRPFVVALGTEERRKGLPLLVESFGIVAGRLTDASLVLAGASGDDSDAVTAAIDALPASARDRVHRLGAFDDTTKQWLLRHAAVLAYPSLDEGFGFPILEAQAAGTPVVASALGSIPEIAGSGASLLSERDAEGLATELVRVLSDGATRLTLIEAGFRNLGRFSWTETARQLADLYHRAREEAR